MILALPQPAEKNSANMEKEKEFCNSRRTTFFARRFFPNTNMIPHTFSLSSPAKSTGVSKLEKCKKTDCMKFAQKWKKISLADTVEIEMLSQGKEGEILFSLENPNQFPVPQDETNLAVRAALSFFQHKGFSCTFSSTHKTNSFGSRAWRREFKRNNRTQSAFPNLP